MLIGPYCSQNRANNIHFGEAKMNVCAFSDVHGKEKGLVDMYANIDRCSDQIFLDKNKPNTLNVMAIVGDCFFNADSKGYLSSKDLTTGEIQLEFLNEFISSVKKIVPGLKTYFTVGNHDLDGGDNLMFKLLKKADMKTILTNVDFDRSKEIVELSSSEKSRMLAKSKILKVKDDKNPELYHKALLLGVSSIGLGYFFPEMDGEPGITDNFVVFDKFKHTEKATKEEELKRTYKALFDEISKFKEENPNSPVIIMSHTGDAVAKFIAKNVDVDFILSGHDHIDLADEDYIPVPGRRTKIISLSQDGKLLKAMQLHFTDKGQMDSVRVNTILSSDIPSLESNPIESKINETLRLDNRPLLQLYPDDEKLDVSSVRYGNSKLANTVTDMILNQIRQRDPEVLAVGIAASAFRRSLANYSSNIDIINVLSGSIESQSLIRTGNLSGQNLAEFILENVAKNKVKPNNLPLTQWSGIKIDKAGLVNILNSEIDSESKEYLLDNLETRYNLLRCNEEKISKCIEIKNASGRYEHIKFYKNYKVALPNKFFVRSETLSVKEFGKYFHKPEFGDVTLNDLMRENLEANNYKIKVSDDIRIIE